MKNKNEELADILCWKTFDPPDKRFTEAQKLIGEGADVNYRDEDGYAIIHTACICTDVKLLKFLIKNKADVNALDIEGDPPIYYFLNHEVNNDEIKIIKCLLISGANIEKFDSNPLLENIKTSLQQEKNSFFEMIALTGSDSYLSRLDDPVIDLIGKIVILNDYIYKNSV